MEKIIIRQGKKTSIECGSIPFPKLLNILLGAINVAANAVVASAKPEIQNAVKEDIYDMINLGASVLLSRFAPEIELRPDLTTTAILQMEDKIIEKDYQKAIKGKKLC